MKLYHGTSVRHLDPILNRGILPRENAPGNWSQTKNPSIPSCVYLSDSLAPYFAMWCQPDTEQTRYGLIIELETEQIQAKDLLPDEDFLRAFFSLRNEPIPQLTDFRGWKTTMLRHRHLWTESLNLLGTCAHDGKVPLKAITRYAIVERTSDNLMRFDNCVNATVHPIMAERLRSDLRFLFDGILPEPNSFDDCIMVTDPPEIVPMTDARWPKLYHEKRQRLLAHRSESVRIVNLKPNLVRNGHS